MTTEMGKTLASAKAEVAKCAEGAALVRRARAGAAASRVPLRRRAPSAPSEAYVVHQPIGVVLAIMPWNFPLWQAMRFAAPGAHGRQRRAAQAREQRAADRALPGGAVPRRPASRTTSSRPCSSGRTTIERVLRDDRVAAATLTGSAPAGQSVASIAGDALKKTVLELGGSDPFIVMPSAHLEKAAEVAVTARVPEQRPELHRGQAVLRARRRRRGVHPAVRREARRADRRRPDGRGHPDRPAGHRVRPGGRRAATCRTRSTRARPSSSAGSVPTARAGSTRRRC